MTRDTETIRIPEQAAEFAPQRVLRFDVPTAEVLERIITEPLPLDLDADDTGTEFFRDLYFDTDARDLERKGAAVRLRIRQEGHRSLMVDLREPAPGDRALLRRRAEASVGEDDAESVFQGDTEPARLLRALVEPDRLSPAFELETLRRLRPVHLFSGDDGRRHPALLTCDAVTVRQGELTGEFRELEVRIPGSAEVPLDPLIDAFQERYGLRVTLADTAGRARELLETLEAGLLEEDVRGAREVVVIAYNQGKIALRRDSGRLLLASGYGMGQEACRRMLKRYFGRTQGRLRILGTVAATTNRPALEVWLAENVRGPAEGDEEEELHWIALEEVLGLVGTGRLRDPRTLAALHVLARSDLPGRLASVWTERTGVLADGEPGLSPAELLESALPLDEELPEGIRPSEVPEQRLLNEELSRLAFDERILVFAGSDETPLLERVRFLSMFGARLDDFFFSRVPRYKEWILEGEDRRTHDGLRAGEELDLIGIRAREMTRRAHRLMADLLPRLAEEGVHILPWSRLDEKERRYLRENYASHVEGVLTPMARDATHPFPHIEALRPAIAALVRPPGSTSEHFVAIELPDELPRFVPLPGGYRFVPLEEVVLASLPDMYPGLEVVRGHTFRITRSIDLRLEEEEVEDVLRAVEEEIALRPYRAVVRLEVDEEMPPEIRTLLLQELRYEDEHTVSRLGDQDVYAVPWIVGLADLKEIGSLDLPDLHFTPAARNRPMEGRPVLDVLREDDVFVHFPEDSFEETVERFLMEAAEDPATLAIKLTVYRTNRRSRIVEALRRARTNDKEAVAVVELKASLDEAKNIEWARSLERAGIHVIFSPLRYKVHAKVAMVVRKEGGGVRRYAFIGTGNLNAETAATYVDLGILTADPELTDEVNAVFNILTGYAARTRCERLLISPFNMRGRFLKMIEEEAEHARAGRPAEIRAQMNGLTDRRLIGALYDASEAGVPVRAMVRELCSLRPGVEGFSETIRVRSLLGRYLQHARIFRFENGGEPRHFIGSADWRPRNLDRRIEIVTPVDHPDHQAALDRILEGTFDDPRGWELGPDGVYRRDGDAVGGRPDGPGGR